MISSWPARQSLADNGIPGISSVATHALTRHIRSHGAMRAAAIRHNIHLLTILSAAQTAVNGIRALKEKELKVRSLQRQHAGTITPL